MSNYTHVTVNGSTVTVDEALAYAERNGVHKPDYMSLDDAAAYVRENYPQFSDLTLHIGDPARTIPKAASIEFDTDFPEFTIESATDEDEDFGFLLTDHESPIGEARGDITSGLRSLGWGEDADELAGLSDEDFVTVISEAVSILRGGGPTVTEGESHGFLDALVVEPASREITVPEFIAAATALREVL